MELWDRIHPFSLRYFCQAILSQQQKMKLRHIYRFHTPTYIMSLKLWIVGLWSFLRGAPGALLYRCEALTRKIWAELTWRPRSWITRRYVWCVRLDAGERLRIGHQNSWSFSEVAWASPHHSDTVPRDGLWEPSLESYIQSLPLLLSPPSHFMLCQKTWLSACRHSLWRVNYSFFLSFFFLQLHPQKILEPTPRKPSQKFTDQ